MWQKLVDKTVPFDTEKTSNILSSTITDNIHHLAMSQTMAALTLAGMATTRSHDPFTSFSMKGKGPALPPSGLAVEEDPQAVDQVACQGAHQVEEEEAHQEVVEPSLPSHLEHQQEVEESLGATPQGSLMGPAAKPTPL